MPTKITYLRNSGKSRVRLALAKLENMLDRQLLESS